MHKLVGLAAFALFLSACGGQPPLTEAEQVTRYIEQEVKRNSRGLNALVAAAEETEFDSLTWRHGERIQLRVREAGEFRTVEDGDAGGVIAAAVANNVPSFSIVRYEDNWLVVFRNYLSDHCQAVYAYAMFGPTDNLDLCTLEFVAEQPNGQCYSPIEGQWSVFKEWFFAEAFVDAGNPVCNEKADLGWRAEAIRSN
ncbi:hypothetical protein [Aliidiomarina haloalkalitolerans]|uniref:Lipoprotein n=1 Tax=Aliidiomarina haloalkalitolerans TaxID=859059 RepID=A0A432VY22_9GAMM|nr:hypothetical protein [Aliidiomarina haloalkalitolerans]RUO21498.1 hypothetical protein CWE06_01165 [Aliidiomarina haloalkalitolerans]